MRRITRRIGLFGPGAVVKASGAGLKKPPDFPPVPTPPRKHAERPAAPAPTPPAAPAPEEKKSFWSRLGFGKKEES